MERFSVEWDAEAYRAFYQATCLDGAVLCLYPGRGGLLGEIDVRER